MRETYEETDAKGRKWTVIRLPYAGPDLDARKPEPRMSANQSRRIAMRRRKNKMGQR